MKLILAMVAAGDITEHHSIMTRTKLINGLSELLAERLMSTHIDANLSLLGQLWEFIVGHDAGNHPHWGQLTQREILIVSSLQVDMYRAAAMTAQGKQRLVGFDFAIPFLVLATHHIEHDALNHSVGLL